MLGDREWKSETPNGHVTGTMVKSVVGPLSLFFAPKEFCPFGGTKAIPQSDSSLVGSESYSVQKLLYL